MLTKITHPSENSPNAVFAQFAFILFMAHPFLMYAGIAAQGLSLVLCSILAGAICFLRPATSDLKFDHSNRTGISARINARIGAGLVGIWLIWPICAGLAWLIPMHSTVADYPTSTAPYVAEIWSNLRLKKIFESLVPSSVILSGIALFALSIIGSKKPTFVTGHLFKFHTWIRVVFAASCFVSVYFLYQHLTGFDFRTSQRYLSNMRFPDGTYRIQGFSGHPLTIGSMALAMVGFSSLLAFFDALCAKKHLVPLLGILFLNLFFLYASGGRTALAVGGIWLALLAFAYLRNKVSPIFVLVGGAITIALLFLATRFLPIFDRFNELFSIVSLHKESGTAGATELAHSLPNRVVFWKIHWQMFLDSPVWGQGTAWMNQGLRTLYYDAMGYGSLHEKFNAHNLYLEILAGVGILGALALIFLTYKFFDKATALFSEPASNPANRTWFSSFVSLGASFQTESRAENCTVSHEEKITPQLMWWAFCIAVLLNLAHGLTQNTFFDSGVTVFYAHLFWAIYWCQSSGKSQTHKSQSGSSHSDLSDVQRIHIEQKLPITACIITLNEEKNIKDCLKSLSFVSEIVVVDSFSTDSTQSKCEEFRARFFKHKFQGHIEQKNIALSYATQPWILALDADERVSDEMRKEIQLHFLTDPAVNGFRFKRRTWYLSRWIFHGRFYPDRQLRLFRRDKARWGGQNPHDKIELEGRFIDAHSDILHFSYENLASHVRTLDKFSAIQAANLFKMRKPNFIVLKIVFKSLWASFDSYVLRRGFLDGVEGVIIAGFAGFSMFTRYAKLYELSIEGKKEEKFKTGNQENK